MKCKYLRLIAFSMQALQSHMDLKNFSEINKIKSVVNI